jgi:hypothetical protein
MGRPIALLFVLVLQKEYSKSRAGRETKHEFSSPNDKKSCLSIRLATCKSGMLEGRRPRARRIPICSPLDQVVRRGCDWLSRPGPLSRFDFAKQMRSSGYLWLT